MHYLLHKLLTGALECMMGGGGIGGRGREIHNRFLGSIYDLSIVADIWLGIYMLPRLFSCSKRISAA